MRPISPAPLLGLAALLLLTACSSAPSAPDPIDNALLAEVSETGRKAVADARASRDLAVDDHAYRVKLRKEAEHRLELARAELRTVRSRLDEAALHLELATERSADESVLASRRHEHATAATDAADEALELRGLELELAKLEERLALETTRLRTAQVELAKARALQGVDLAEVRGIPLADHVTQVEYHEGLVDAAREKAAKQSRKVEQSRRALDALEARRDALDVGA